MHEHPRLARSWDEPCIRGVLSMKGVGRINADQCQFGQQDDLVQPIMKPTGFMSNSSEILRSLNVQCHGKIGRCSRPEGGKHVQCIGVRARRAAIFQDKLCLAILRGLRQQLVVDGRMRRNETGITSERSQLADADDAMKAFLLDSTQEPACPRVKSPPF